MNKILILSHAESDLSALILAHCKGACLARFEELQALDLAGFDALAVLGGNGEKPYAFSAFDRQRIDAFQTAGKPVFFEYVLSCGLGYSETGERMTHHRMVYREGAARIAGLTDGDVLDGHCNELLTYWNRGHGEQILLSYFPYVPAHDHIVMDDEAYAKGTRALFVEKNELVCAFRLCNFRRAMLAPRKSFEAVICYVVDFLAGEHVSLQFLPPVCEHLAQTRVKEPMDVSDAVQAGLAWFTRAGILLDEGRNGVLEGFSHHVDARNGARAIAPTIRTDCSGETGGAYLFDFLVTGNEESRRRFEALEDFCFDAMQVKEGRLAGMVRWSNVAWSVCYGDDVARAILPTLLCKKLAPEMDRHFADAVEALRFLVDTTGSNGLRVSRTDQVKLTEEKLRELRETESGLPTAHHNAFYHAALLLCAMNGGPKEYQTVAEKGLSAIMATYPGTLRETSETEELCRLVFPLAALYEATGKAEHREWLYRVVTDLARLQHASGGYREWDTGYTANCSRRENGECALLAENGDPVVDLLYSNNWLPLGFAYAYHVTGDRLFYTKWLEIAGFMLRAQIHSDEAQMDGAWARAFDLSRDEIHGVPHDVGWAPCCIESGWTVAEILMGLQLMTLIEK